MEDKDNQKRMEEEFLEIFTALNKHLEHLYEVSSKDQQQKVFVLGDGAPCALDAVLLGGIYAHFYQDPIPRSIIQSRFPFISKWLTENFYAGKSGNFPQWPKHQKVDLLNLPPFFQLILQKISTSYLPWLNGNYQALKAGKKSFVIQIDYPLKKEISYLARRYPEKSRRMFLRWVEAHLKPQDKVRLINLLRQYEIIELSQAVPRSKL